jgi:hypothetical protein
MVERWKKIPNYENLYEISSLGRVKSVTRTSSIGRKLKEKFLKKSLTSKGYAQVGLYKEAIKKTIEVHVLMGITFLGHTRTDKGGIIVDHRDNNPLNNILVNLQLITHRHNLSKDKKNKTSKYTGVHWSILCNKWIATIRIKNKKMYLGTFINEIDASIAYKQRLKLLY